ncbi:MAG: hypothetical protein HeimC3_46900 [Candidatus Heimdallarchaeota archaeon LC_3]|nr:MAG: hypothetical protein HeimC3_46900 [Candidatus Heimdallarchaeota archaeon LC_3]
MTRFPKFEEFHKKIFVEYFKTQHVNQLMKVYANFADEHKGTLDGEIGALWLAEWLMYFNQFDQMLPILESLEQSKDQIIRILTYGYYFFYYNGWLHPPVDVDKANEYYEKAKKEIQSVTFQDDWEKYYTLSIILHAEVEKEPDLEKKIELIEKLRISNSKLPEYGHLFKLYQEISYGQIFEQHGKFEKARISYSHSIELCKETDVSVFGLSGLVNISIITGDLTQAKRYSSINLEKAIAGGNYFITRLAYNMHAYVLELNSEYQKAEELLLKVVEMSIKKGIPNLKFSEYNSLFSFYLRMHNISKEEDQWKNAVKYRHKLISLANDNPKDLTMDRLSKRANALILKMGGLRERVQAIDIFEELIEYYPTGLDRFYQKIDRTIELKMYLVEMYFQDLSNDIVGDTKQKIDVLINDIGKSPLMKNPTTISEYSSYQLLVAKYKYYVKGDIEEALELLHELKSQAVKYALNSIVEKITNEIQILESEITKWKNINLSTLERIKKSELNSYLMSALNLVRGDTSID